METIPTTYEAKLGRLRASLAREQRLAVAFSGGVDSSVLLHAAHAALGERALGVIADSPSLPREELALAREVARAIGARWIEVRTSELDDERYRRNAGDRCYFCKSALFEAMAAWARAEAAGGAPAPRLAFGEITDDFADVRPGARAAREYQVLAPLSGAGFSKEDVRRYARDAGLAVAEKPASACLASRLPIGTAVTRERLERIERAEAAVRAQGFRVLRVRDHGARARVEVGEDELALARARTAELGAALAPEGFLELEIEAYRRPAGFS